MQVIDWVPAAIFFMALAFGIARIALEMIPPATSNGTVTSPLEQTIEHPRAATN